MKRLRPSNSDVEISEDHIQSLLNARRGREQLFGRQLFSDPAWDLILELYSARLGKRDVSTSELARAIEMPGPIVERWVKALTKADIVVEEVKSATAFIRLTEDAAAKMALLANRWGSAFLAI